jgi:hypothetical protein
VVSLPSTRGRPSTIAFSTFLGLLANQQLLPVDHESPIVTKGDISGVGMFEGCETKPLVPAVFLVMPDQIKRRFLVEEFAELVRNFFDRGICKR